MYYRDKLATLSDLFGSTNLHLEPGRLTVDGRTYPVVDDVIVLLDPSQYPPRLRQRLAVSGPAAVASDFAEDIQFTFGEEWQRFSEILPEHRQEFLQYFDLLDLPALSGARVCDLGCGIGRWSYFLSGHCRELVLVDFSEAIFVARRNLAHARNGLFFMADLRRLPFRARFADLLFCLGVLHHLPVSALDEVRSLQRYARRLLIYLYYALDNRPRHYRLLLALVTGLRRRTAAVRNPAFRSAFSWLGTLGLYLPLVGLGSLLRPFGLARHVPLYDSYHGKGLRRIRQDVYDRFFTRIEQRYSRQHILSLADTFPKVTVSERWPYWHFLCESE